MTLPEPIAAYFAAKNRKDVEAMLAPFSAHAIVKDEGQELHGLAPIRGWMEETTRKYAVTVEPKSVAVRNGSTVVTALVSGNFGQHGRHRARLGQLRAARPSFAMRSRWARGRSKD